MNAAVSEKWYRQADSWQLIFFLFILASANLSIAVNQICLGLSLALLLYKGLSGGNWPPRTRLEKPALALAVWALVMIPFSYDAAQSGVFYRRFFLFTALWVGVSLATSERRRYLMLAATLAGAVAVSLSCEIQIFQRAGGLFTTRFMGASNSMTSGVLLMLAVIVGLSFLAISGLQRRWRIVVTAAVMLIALAMFQTMTRSAIMGLLAGIGAMILLARPRVFFVFFAAAVLGVVVVSFFGEHFLPAQVWLRLAPEAWFDSTSSIGMRMEMWGGGWEIFKVHPLTGVGDCDLTAMMPQYYGDETTRYFGHLHSNPLMLLAIWGLPGFVFAQWFTLLPLVILIKRWRALVLEQGAREKSPAQAAWILATVGVVVGFYIAGLTEWYFGDAEAMSLYLAIIGIGLGRDSLPKTAT